MDESSRDTIDDQHEKKLDQAPALKLKKQNEETPSKNKKIKIQKKTIPEKASKEDSTENHQKEKTKQMNFPFPAVFSAATDKTKKSNVRSNDLSKIMHRAVKRILCEEFESI